MNTIIFWGQPGTGKTAAVRAFAGRHGRHLEAILPGIREPSDILGLPDIRLSGGRRVTDHALPAWVARLWDAYEAGRLGLLFIDELNTATPAMQAALLGLLLDGATDAWSLPPGCWRLAAANPLDCAAGGWDLSAPAANRLIHRDWPIPAAAEWAAGLMSGWDRPPATPLDAPEIPGILGGTTDAAANSRARALVGGFIVARPALQQVLPRHEAERGRAWPSCRSWHTAEACIAATLATGGDLGRAAEWVAACVGDPAASEWLTWAQSADIPDPESVLAAGGHWSPPTRGDIAWAACAALAEAVRSRPEPARIEAALAALDRLPVDLAAIHAGTIARAGMSTGWRPAGSAAKYIQRYSALLQ